MLTSTQVTFAHFEGPFRISWINLANLAESSDWARISTVPSSLFQTRPYISLIQGRVRKLSTENRRLEHGLRQLDELFSSQFPPIMCYVL